MRYVTNKFYIILAVLMINGCAVWDFIKPASDGISVDTEIVAGDKQEEIATGAVVGKRETSNTTNTAETITQTYQTVNEGKTLSDIILYCLMAFLLGWLAMPSTRQMIIMVKNLTNRRNNK